MCLLLLALTPGSTRAGESLERSLFIPLSVAIVKVHARLSDGRLSVGTGLTVAPGVVMTNCHVMAGAEKVTISTRPGFIEARAQHAAARRDLCFLKVPAWQATPITIAPDPMPRLHQRTAAIGFTGGLELSFSEGSLSAIYAFENSYLLQTTSGFSSGASGGALLDDQARLLGVLTFRLPGNSGHYYAVPASWIVDDMPDEKDWQEIGSPISRKPFWFGDIANLPFFMRVAPLEAQSRWTDLLDLAGKWSVQEPDSAEPLIVRGQTLVRLNRLDEAIDVFTLATARDAMNTQAWFELGRTLGAARRADETGPARARLAELDRALLIELEQHLAKSQ